MNSDTQRTTKTILDRGWYMPHQTLGEGGWAYLHPFTQDWKQYILRPSIGTSEIIAKDDETAVAAFNDLFWLDNSLYEIIQITTTYRVVADNVFEKEK